MKKIGNVFSAVSGTFALIPGIAVLITEVGVPPGSSKVLFATVIESLGALCLLLLWVNKAKIEKLSSKTVTRLSILLGVAFLVFLVVYLQLFGLFVIVAPGSESLLFPFWPAGELAEGLQLYGSKATLIREWGRDDVFKVIQESSFGALQWTKILFLVIYVAVFICLTAAFGFLGINIKSSEVED